VKYFKLLLLVLSLALVSSSPLLAASLEVGNVVTYSLSSSITAGGFGSGGIFTLTEQGGDHTSIQTFCLELTEHLNSPLRVDSLDMVAIAGGRGGQFPTPSSPDPINTSTAWLYRQFRNGVSGYSEASNGQALQLAFWILEQEITLAEADAWAGTHPYYAAAMAYVNAANSANTINTTNFYGVHVVNLKTDSVNSQSFPDVPDGGLTVMLLGIGVGALTIISRKRTSSR
jgi:hypothetical protein